MLSASLDPDQTLERIVRLAVPRVACFAALDLSREAGVLERVGYAHIDPELQPLLRRTEVFDPRAEGLLPLAQVLESGQPLMIEDVEAAWPRELPEDRQSLERLRSLAARSLIVVPLVVRGAMLGTLTLGSTRTDRFYRSEDLTLARELGRSAGLALENARLYREAQRAVRARDEVLSVVSHDLRNPVSRVRMAAELLLEREQLEASARGPLDMIVRAADEMTRLIADLLDVARIEEGRLGMEPRRVALSTILKHLDQAHAETARRHDLEWRVERRSSDVVLDVDEGRLIQALGNLIGNAMKFTPRGGRVGVEARVEPAVVVLGVVDTGPGLTAEQLAHVFDRFWQARAGDRRGAGLGLAIARGIAEAHGGRLWLESEEGAGTRAWLELPRLGGEGTTEGSAGRNTGS